VSYTPAHIRKRAGRDFSKTFFAIGAAGFIVASVVGWAAIPTSQARVAEPATIQVDTFATMASAKQVPAEHFADYSFVFN
jgi:hypothetical protein